MAEGTRLLSEYGVYHSIAGSNPALSVGPSREQDPIGEAFARFSVLWIEEPDELPA